MIQNILNTANKYATGLDKIRARRGNWLAHYKEVRTRLKEIAIYLNENSTYKQGFYVDTNHAFNEAINGTCANLPSLTLRTGEMPMEVSFKNAMAEHNEYTEEGFVITFTPVITGQIVVLLLPHVNSLSEEKREYIDLALIDNPGAITPDIIDQIVARGIETAYYTSFTGMAEHRDQNVQDTEPKRQYTPIGSKRYESTEKLK